MTRRWRGLCGCVLGASAAALFLLIPAAPTPTWMPQAEQGASANGTPRPNGTSTDLEIRRDPVEKAPDEELLAVTKGRLTPEGERRAVERLQKAALSQEAQANQLLQGDPSKIGLEQRIEHGRMMHAATINRAAMRSVQEGAGYITVKDGDPVPPTPDHHAAVVMSDHGNNQKLVIYVADASPTVAASAALVEEFEQALDQKVMNDFNRQPYDERVRRRDASEKARKEIEELWGRNDIGTADRAKAIRELEAVVLRSRLRVDEHVLLQRR
jgi:hypothetical protein